MPRHCIPGRYGTALWQDGAGGLGGKNNFAADREVANKVVEAWPAIRIGVRENRKFLARVVRYLAEEVGIRQFLDIGTGLPTADNTHEVAQAVAPAARIVYVDNDPLAGAADVSAYGGVARKP